MRRFWFLVFLALCMLAGRTGAGTDQPQTTSFFLPWTQSWTSPYTETNRRWQGRKH